MTHMSFVSGNRTLVFNILTIVLMLDGYIMIRKFAVVFVLIGLVMSIQTGHDAHAQDYQRLWKEVAELESNGLPKSARDKVQEIYATSLEQGDADHTIKALLFLSRYITQLEEDEVNSVFDLLADGEDKLSPPASNLLKAVKGELYWQYYQARRYQIFNRPPVAGGETPDDIDEWDAAEFIRTSIAHYESALLQAELLQSVSISDFDELLISGDYQASLRPTLYDFIAHWALDQWMNSESGLPIPQDQFLIDDPRFLAPASEFVNLDIQSGDTLSFQYRTIELFKDLLAFRLEDDNLEALIDADLKRLQYVHSNATFADADSLYKDALEELARRKGDDPAVAPVHVAIAIQYQRLSNNYQPGQDSSEFKWFRKDALTVCEEVQQRWPNSHSASNCTALIASLKNPNLSIQVPSVVVPQTPFLARIDFRNQSRANVIVVPVDRSAIQQLDHARQQERRRIIGRMIESAEARRHSFTLPDDGDMHNHSTEVSLSGLSAGSYLMIITSADDHRQVDPGYTAFQVSRNSFISRARGDGTTEIIVADRSTGLPIPNSQVVLWQRTFDSSARRQVLNWITEHEVDDDGRVTITTDNRQQYTISVVSDSDELFTDYTFYSRIRQPDNRVQQETRLFTDRSIYRPGQTVYFKGLLLSFQNDEYQIAAGRESTVKLHDVNGQELDSVTLTSNEFGTVQGSFIIPSSVLPGSMRLFDAHGSVSFSVEEYKRPRFEVSIDEVEGANILGEEITMTGKATSLAGADIGNAEVRYRVTRSPAYHPWWRFGRSIFPRSAPAEIASGSIQTAADGTFEVKFEALPDKRLDPAADPSFTFSLDVTVIDITGESIDASRSTRLNYSGLVVGIDGPVTFDVVTPPQLRLISTNPDGVPVNVSGSVQIIKLRPPDRPLRDRLWAKVDTVTLDQSAMRLNHPLDGFRDEDNPDSWDETEVVETWEFETSESRSIPEGVIQSLAPGVYRLKVSASNSSGREAGFEKVVTVYDTRSDELPRTLLSFFETPQISARVGETVPVVIGSSTRARILFEVEIGGEIVMSDWKTISGEQQTISVDVSEEHQGGFVVRSTMIHSDRVFSQTRTIDVPYQNRKLDISFSTFRSKLRPGADEEWTIRIAGEDGMPVAAEMMATMYDASLDMLAPHAWSLDLSLRNYPQLGWNTSPDWGADGAHVRFSTSNYHSRSVQYPQFDFFGLSMWRQRILMRSAMAEGMESQVGELAADVVSADLGQEAKEPMIVLEDTGPESVDEVNIRKNLNELAFFMPQLRTDSTGAVVLAFTMPEALTRWRMMSLAHTRDLQIGQMDTTVVTSKELMVVPNPPRFLRRGDDVYFSAKVTNMSADSLSGNVRLELFDPATELTLDDSFALSNAESAFATAPGESVSVKWEINVPGGRDMVGYRVVAVSNRFSDGEESVLPVLDSRMMITETLPLWTSGKGTKTFSFDRLLDPPSETMDTYRVTLEYSANPVWYAVQALPYLNEYPHEGADHIFSRLYGNAVSGLLLRTNPGMEEVIQTWTEQYPDAMKSNLQKNEELKSVVLRESPWVRDAISEEARKRSLVELFDEGRIREGLADAVLKLEQLQLAEGGWPWFAGMRPSRFTTQNIVKGFGWLRQIGALDIPGSEHRFSTMTRNALVYLDHEIVRDYERLVDRSADLEKRHIHSIQLHYLFSRTLFNDYQRPTELDVAYNFYLGQVKTYWTDFSVYEKALAAAILHREGDTSEAAKILASIREYSLYSEELGTYWKMNSGYAWYEAPVETQAQIIATFIELGASSEEVASMQRWLIKQKQTQNWKTPRATSDAVYAILRSDMQLLTRSGEVQIELGGDTVVSGDEEREEPATGYVKQVWEGDAAQSSLGQVVVTSQNDNPTWGAVYWQYYEEQDKVTAASTPLQVTKEIYHETITDSGPVLLPVNESADVSPGAVLKVRLTVKLDRDMEYLHLKDLRAAGTEPVAVQSGYKWGSGTGYYEAVSDASTSFFFDRLPKGTWVIDYELRANLAGDFGVGPATIQNMYAPEFAANSKGLRLQIDE